jgi:hypothetical protein
MSSSAPPFHPIALSRAGARRKTGLLLAALPPVLAGQYLVGLICQLFCTRTVFVLLYASGSPSPYFESIYCPTRTLAYSLSAPEPVANPLRVLFTLLFMVLLLSVTAQDM